MFRRGLAIFDLQSNFSQHGRWNAIGFILGVYREHPDCRGLNLQEVDDPNTSAFPATFGRPAELSYTAGSRNHRASLRLRCQGLLMSQVLIVVEVLSDQPVNTCDSTKMNMP